MSTRVNEKNFEEIYKETYLGTLKFITIRCYHIDDVNDILQDTYVEFYKILQKKKNLIIEKNQSYINRNCEQCNQKIWCKEEKFGLFSE